MTSGYGAYKASSIAWIDVLPAHWEVKPLLAVAQERDVRNAGLVEDNLLSLSYGNIIRKDISSNEGLLPESFDTYQIVEPDDVVFRLTDLQNDKRSLRTGLVRERGIITSAYLAVEPTGILPDYFSHLLRAYDLSKVFYSMGGGLRQSMKYDDVRRMPVVLPPLPEQTAIAAFLNRETGKIDALVMEQKQLIELLKEKRQAVISHAVTKGLDPNARMKPSGVEWLGDAPEHWNVRRIKHLSSLISKGTTPTTIGADFTAEGVRFLKAENLSEGSVQEQPEFFISEQTHEQMGRSQLRAGDVLVVIAGATTGKSAVLPPAFVPANTNQAVAFIRPTTQMDPQWINLWLSIDAVQRNIALGSVQSAQPNLAMEDLGNIPIFCPPEIEASEIVRQLSANLKMLDELCNQAGRAVALLQERRSALISAAVTGKLDVRDIAVRGEAV